MNLTRDEILTLTQSAIEAADFAYARYSNFPVGAAILTTDGIHTGANIENASYGLTLCAERAAFVKALSTGLPTVRAIAVACVKANAERGIAELLPCGACRQWMAEFAGPDLTVLLCGFRGAVHTFTLEQLLPNPFQLA
jgi:cytidine deaminase